VHEQGRLGYEGIVQGEHSLAKLDHHLREEEEDAT
jgi:hypothetical protein